MLHEIYTHREIFSEFYKPKQNLDCIYPFPIDFAPNGDHFGAKSMGKE